MRSASLRLLFCWGGGSGRFLRTDSVACRTFGCLQLGESLFYLRFLYMIIFVTVHSSRFVSGFVMVLEVSLVVIIQRTIL